MDAPQRRENFPIDTIRYMENKIGNLRYHVMENAAAAAEKRDAGDPYTVIHKDIDTALQQIVEVLKEKGVGVLTSRNEDFPQPTREHQAAGLAHVKVMTLVDSRGHISETIPSAIKYAHEHPDESVAFRHNDFVIDVAPDAKAEDLFRAFQRLDAQKRSRPSLGR